jgi:hypothetical protein
MTKGIRWTIAGVAAAAVLAVAACGADPPAAGPASPSPPSGPPSPTEPASSPTEPAPIPASSAAPVTGRYAPTIDPTAFSSTVDNPFFPLRPGMRWEYRTETDEGVETTVVVATTRTRTVMGVPCVEVRDTVRLDGEVIEDTLDWYAQHRDGTVWYFGEDTKEYEDGKVVTTAGSWEGGVDGALPGIIMPATPTVGDHYRQEFYRGHAEDIGEVLALSESARVPAGSYTGVVKTKDTTPLEPKVLEHKYYARGVGPVLTIDVAGGGTRDELVRFTG